MNIIMSRYRDKDIPEMRRIWNEVVNEGNAFPQLDPLVDVEEAAAFFGAQTVSGVAIDTDTNNVVGLFILHPNNVGRCGHLCNASFAVDSRIRGQHIGEKLVLSCLEAARESGYRVMQFNAVVESNIHARNLYKRLGFTELGMIPGGFRHSDGSYENIFSYYKEIE